MASASMNDIKARMKSVTSTMQITKAMELVATSKLRRAKERAERTRPYYEALGDCLRAIVTSGIIEDTPFFGERPDGRTLYIVIAGDRGLAGGYNSNIFKLSEHLSADKQSVFLPIGKKALEYFRGRNKQIIDDSYEYSANIGVGESLSIGSKLTEWYLEGKFDRAVMVYTKFVSMLTQTAVYEDLLPLSIDKEDSPSVAEFDGEIEKSLGNIVSEYIGGIVYSALAESVASEHGARRSAMNSANKNAEEMIDTLMLKFNRARQAVITQEITEIVSGAEAL